jgi:hypothetical protein
MIFRKALLTLVLASLPSIVIAEGTPQEQAACRPDVRKFCYKVPQSAGSKAFQDCLESNRNLLSDKCKQAMAAHKS